MIQSRVHSEVLENCLKQKVEKLLLNQKKGRDKRKRRKKAKNP